MEEKLTQAYLFDFYGEMLNEHQRRIYEDFVFNDLSLGEIAGEEGISRQGVADMVKRCDKKLRDYEDKLHLVDKFISIKSDVEKIKELAVEFKETNDILIMNEIELISNQIIEEL
ncbi:MAG: DNA-binding protein [Lachnobacterium sp.]|nr:DNA-binding protein [Lachnobacterium sp.]MDD6633333.1 DNA-binding protein [Lachnobacterium sp.]MDY2912355.1 DNA-binding protein [Agathobacter sp.]